MAPISETTKVDASFHNVAMDEKLLFSKEPNIITTITSASSSMTSLTPSTSSQQSQPPSKPSLPMAKEPPVTWMSLPNKPQLFILAICRLSEPLSNTCLLPYLYYLVRATQQQQQQEHGLATVSSISRSAGLLVATFALAQFATSMLWAKLADRYGRKKVIVFGLLVSIIANIGFGLSTTMGALMFWRTTAGVANGNIGVMRTMTAEIVKERKYQSRAFLLLPLVFNSGVIVGLGLGGVLAMPVKNWPSLFGKDGWLNIAGGEKGVEWMVRYPFLLPTVANATMLSFGLLLAVGWLKETLDGKGRDYGLVVGRTITRFLRRVVKTVRPQSGYSSLPLDEEHNTSASPSTPSRGGPPPGAGPKLTGPPPSILTRTVLTTLIPFTLLPLHNATFMQLFPLLLSTPNSSTFSSPIFFTGGLGLTTSTIGAYLSAFGCSGIFLQLFIYPRLQARYGTLNILRASFVMFPITYLLTPYVILLPNFPLRAFATAVVLFIQVMARTLAIPSTVILLTNAAPEKRVLGTVHGAGNMMSSFSRAVGPAVGGWVSAWGIERGVMGTVWWGYLGVIAVFGIVSTMWLKDIEDKSGRPGVLAAKRKELDVEIERRGKGDDAGIPLMTIEERR